MTKKDYELIAEALKDGASYDLSKNIIVDGNYYAIVEAMSKRLYAENKKFDIQRFFTACGIIEQLATWQMLSAKRPSQKKNLGDYKPYSNE